MTNTYKSTILIADDEPRGRQTLESLLFAENYQLLFAENGVETLEIAEKYKPDLILLDVMMPGMTGFEVCQKIRANEELEEMPIILVTALDDKESRIKGIEAGADDFITKPINSRELRLRIKTITRLDRYRQIHKAYTEKFNLEQELKREKELNALKSAFVSMASHEFRTPLATISFATGFLNRYLEKLGPEEIKQKLNNIEVQVKHMTGLLEDVLSLGKTDAKQTVIKKTKLNFSNFIQPIIEQISFTTNYKNKFVTIDNSKDSMIYLDEELGKNIFINILSNAAKFSDNEKEIKILVENTEFETKIEIIDSGIGIDNKELEGIFTAFQRGSNVGTIQGTGLGLAIVKKAMERHNGDIKIESEPGKGTKVTLILPFE